MTLEEAAYEWGVAAIGNGAHLPGNSHAAQVLDVGHDGGSGIVVMVDNSNKTSSWIKSYQGFACYYIDPWNNVWRSRTTWLGGKLGLGAVAGGGAGGGLDTLPGVGFDVLSYEQQVAALLRVRHLESAQDAVTRLNANGYAIVRVPKGE